MKKRVLDNEDGHYEASKHNESKLALRKLIGVSAICILFCTIEFFGGYFSGSMAIMTDAAHLLSDFSGFVISMVSVWIGTKEANRRLSFGFHRAEVIGALASVILIWGLTLILVLEAIERIINPVKVDGPIMLTTATLGLIFNLIMVKILHSGNESHHGCTHSHEPDPNTVTYEMEEMGIERIDLSYDDKKDENLELRNYDSLDEPEIVGSQFSRSFDMKSIKLDNEAGTNTNRSSIFDLKNYQSNDSSRNMADNNRTSETLHFHHHHTHSASDNLNVRAAAIHIIGDIIQSVGVLVAALLIYMEPSWNIIDPICTFMFSVLVICTTYYIVKDCMIILLEGVPPTIPYDDVRSAIQSVAGVIAIKELHIWSLTSGKNCIAAKLIAKSNNSVVIAVHDLCKHKFKIQKCYIEVNTV